MYKISKENPWKQCPVCGADRDYIKKHIMNQAKNECFEWYISKQSIPTPHLRYVENNYQLLTSNPLAQ